MPTRNIWKPGMVATKTPMGLETEVPETMSEEEKAAYLERLDSEYATDPEAQARRQKAESRRARWNRQQEPIRAWVQFYQALPEGDGKPQVYSEEYEEMYRAWVRNYRGRGEDGAKQAAEQRLAFVRKNEAMGRPSKPMSIRNINPFDEQDLPF